MRLRDDGGAGEQAVGERLRDGARLGRAGLRRVLEVLREQLDGVADLVERDDLLRIEWMPCHHAAEDAVLADALVEVRLEEVDLVELVGRDLDPDLVVLLPQLEEAGDLLRVLDDVGEWPRLALRSRPRQPPPQRPPLVDDAPDDAPGAPGRGALPLAAWAAATPVRAASAAPVVASDVLAAGAVAQPVSASATAPIVNAAAHDRIGVQ